MAEVIGDLDELISLLRRSARQAALDVEASAQRQAQQAVDEARTAAQSEHDAIVTAVDGSHSYDHRRSLSRVTLELQQETLVAREALFDQVWTAAEGQLRRLTADPSYLIVLRRLAFSAIPILGQTTITLAADRIGHDLMTDDVLAEWSAAAHVQFVRADQPAPIWGGLLAWDLVTRRQVDASFATRLAQVYTERRRQIAQCLGIL